MMAAKELMKLGKEILAHNAHTSRYLAKQAELTASGNFDMVPY